MFWIIIPNRALVSGTRFVRTRVAELESELHLAKNLLRCIKGEDLPDVQRVALEASRNTLEKANAPLEALKKAVEENGLDWSKAPKRQARV